MKFAAIAAEICAKYPAAESVTAPPPRPADPSPALVDADAAGLADDLAERESIAIIDGGLPPEWAAALAAIERGPRPASISERDWRVALDAVWRRAAEHGAEFAACGWTFSEIFGVGEHWLRLDQRGVAWFAMGARIVSIDAERIVFERGSERRVHRRPH